MLTDETRAHSPSRFAQIVDLFGPGVDVDTVLHTALKQRSKSVKAVIRTGDFAAYCNVLLVSGSGGRWYVETP